MMGLIDHIKRGEEFDFYYIGDHLSRLILNRGKEL
jgi:hypothetical protein